MNRAAKMGVQFTSDDFESVNLIREMEIARGNLDDKNIKKCNLWLLKMWMEAKSPYLWNGHLIMRMRMITWMISFWWNLGRVRKIIT
jgi:hypothetical protein